MGKTHSFVECVTGFRCVDCGLGTAAPALIRGSCPAGPGAEVGPLPMPNGQIVSDPMPRDVEMAFKLLELAPINGSRETLFAREAAIKIIGHWLEGRLRPLVVPKLDRWTP